MHTKNDDDLIYRAWRDAEAYAVPMTEKQQEYAAERFQSFKQGWIYAKFHTEHNEVQMRDFDDYGPIDPPDS